MNPGPDNQLWPSILAHLRVHHPTLCRQWFEQLAPQSLDAGVLRLRAHTSIHRDYLQRSCADAFNDAARTVSERLLSVQFLGPDDPTPASTSQPPANPVAPASLQPSAALSASSRPGRTTAASALDEPLVPVIAPVITPVITPVGKRPPVPSSAAAGLSRTLGESPDARQPTSSDRPREPIFEPKPRRAIDDAPAAGLAPVRWELTSKPISDRLSGLVINPDYGFEHFVVGPNNRLAHAAALSVAAEPGKSYNPYFVHGGVGLGKTHLLQAICLKIKVTQPGVRIFYTSCEGFMTQFMDAVQAGEMVAFRHRFRDVDLLVIDDVHFLAKRDRTQEEFFHTFNTLYQAGKQIILSSDAPPEDIPDLEARLVSRFKCGLVTTVAPPAYETRVAILKNKARMHQFDLPDDVACHIAAKIDSNVRELEGAVTKLHVLHSVERRPVDLAMARAALGEEASRVERQVQIQSIITAVTEFYGVKITDLQSKRRQRSIALPRQVCMFLARKHTRYSLEEIGGYFGGRDHTTVMHAVRTVEGRTEVDSEFARVISSLDTQVKLEAT
jgi:chromosomal replication initiator protein